MTEQTPSCYTQTKAGNCLFYFGGDVKCQSCEWARKRDEH